MPTKQIFPTTHETFSSVRVLAALLLALGLGCSQRQEEKTKETPPSPTPASKEGATRAPTTKSKEEPASLALVLTPTGFGPYQISLPGKEALALPGAKRVEIQCGACDYGVEIPKEGVLLAVTLDKGQVGFLSLTKPGPKTKEGLGVGSRYDEIAKVYGEAEILPATGEAYFAKSPYEFKFPGEGMPKRSEACVSLCIGACGD